MPSAASHLQAEVTAVLLVLQLDMMRSETVAHARSFCVNQVLGTDMKKHFDITSRFQVSHRAMLIRVHIDCCCLNSRMICFSLQNFHYNSIVGNLGLLNGSCLLAVALFAAH
jgi:hypothetical protein